MKYAIVAILLAMSTPSAAQLANPFAMTADPADRAVMAEAVAALDGRKPDIG